MEHEYEVLILVCGMEIVESTHNKGDQNRVFINSRCLKD